MISKTAKRQLGVFVASFVLTACVIIFAWAFVTVEKNTGKMLGKASCNTFLFSIEQANATITVNDREYSISIEALSRVLKSKESALVTLLLFTL